MLHICMEVTRASFHFRIYHSELSSLFLCYAKLFTSYLISCLHSQEMYSVILSPNTGLNPIRLLDRHR
jgi:hypothetical protein